jgi:hypothetical protein
MCAICTLHLRSSVRKRRLKPTQSSSVPACGGGICVGEWLREPSGAGLLVRLLFPLRLVHIFNVSIVFLSKAPTQYRKRGRKGEAHSEGRRRECNGSGWRGKLRDGVINHNLVISRPLLQAHFTPQIYQWDNEKL